MTLSEIQLDCYRSTGHLDSPGTEITNRYLTWINQAHKEILQKPAFRKFRRRYLTATSIADTPFMALPHCATRVFDITDASVDYHLKYKDMAWIRRQDPGLTASGSNPWVWSVYSYASPTFRKISVAAGIDLWLDSTAAGDTQVAHVQVVRASTGQMVSLSKTLTGTTAVQLSSTITNIVDVAKFFLATAAVGEVTLHEDVDGGTEIARIPIGKTFSRYTLAYLWPVPTDAVEYTIDAEIEVADMSVAGDEPLIPYEFQEILVAKVRSKEWERREKVALKKEADARVATLLRDFHHYAAQQESPSEDNMERRMSQLGPFFEPGT